MLEIRGELELRLNSEINIHDSMITSLAEY